MIWLTFLLRSASLQSQQLITEQSVSPRIHTLNKALLT